MTRDTHRLTISSFRGHGLLCAGTRTEPFGQTPPPTFAAGEVRRRKVAGATETLALGGAEIRIQHDRTPDFGTRRPGCLCGDDRLLDHRTRADLGFTPEDRLVHDGV